MSNSCTIVAFHAVNTAILGVMTFHLAPIAVAFVKCCLVALSKFAILCVLFAGRILLIEIKHQLTSDLFALRAFTSTFFFGIEFLFSHNTCATVGSWVLFNQVLLGAIC